MNPGETLHSGDLIRIGPGSGGACRHMYARVIRVNPWPAWDGMCWLDVHETDAQGHVLEDERMAYVAVAGIRVVKSAADCTAEAAALLPQRRRPANTRPPRIPRPRTRTPEITPSGGIR